MWFESSLSIHVADNPRETRFGNGTQVKPCRSGLRTGWVTNHQYHLKGPYGVLSFLLLLFCILCGVIVNSVLKSRCSIISAPGFTKRQKQRTNLARRSSPENYYSSGRNTELKLCRLWSTYIGGDGFWTVNDHNASDSNLLFLCLLLSALPSLC